MMSDDIETKFFFDDVVNLRMGEDIYDDVAFVRRVDYHDDGSESAYFFVELTEEQYQALLACQLQESIQ